jgi:hypothetical protein
MCFHANTPLVALTSLFTLEGSIAYLLTAAGMHMELAAAVSARL